MIDDPISVDIHLLESVAELGKLLGLGKSSSLVLALLFPQPEPLSLDEIAQSTGVAKSSISVVLKNLEQMGLVQEVGRANDRRKFYQAEDDLQDAVAALLARRLSGIAARQPAAPTADPARCAAPQDARLAQLQAVYDSLALLASFFRTRRAEAWQELQTRLAANAPQPEMKR